VSYSNITCHLAVVTIILIYFDLLLNIIESNHHDTRSAYDFMKADYDAKNDVLSSHPFNNNIVEANSAENVCFTDSVDDVWTKFISPLNNAFEAFIPVRSVVSLKTQ